MIFNQATILPSYQPSSHESQVLQKNRTTVLAAQTHSSMQDEASEVVALGGFNFVFHLSRLSSKLKVISDKCFSTQLEIYSRLSPTLRTLHEQCLGLWVSDCGMLCLGTISKHLPISHPFPSIILQEVLDMRWGMPERTLFALSCACVKCAESALVKGADLWASKQVG